ncbi:MAG TPA: FecR family protein, partial [Opitutaceae bacterium]|nr:FecR family protein [Opitutaceae bacterium]
MKKYFAVPSLLGSFLLVSLGHAADLKQSMFTQVVNDVQVVSAANSSEKPAVVNAVFNMPDLVRTGAASRAELVAEDKTITRVGANTVFSFDQANRTINLQQGSLLFHSPKGMGGGTIHTNSATASVLGTTLIVTTTRSGGFKVIDLEGHVAIRFLSGVHQDLNPGQMTFVLAGGRPAPVLTIRLDTLTKDSHLVQGF